MHLLFTTGGLLLLALVLLVTGRTGKGLLEDLEDLLILDLLVALVQLQVDGVGGGKLGETVLGDGYREMISGLSSNRFRYGSFLPTVVSRRDTGVLSAEPAGSYWRTTPLRTHSTTPTLAVFSSSSWRKLKGKVPNFLTISERTWRELGRFRP
jgi:hypothetical protein